ncbi:MAG: divergent polysaccharide deacetylase family protein, partial [Bacillota bacterium]|nr:divergent polysaccharide deacetylase family protein [Bacillota bacterium]
MKLRFILINKKYFRFFVLSVLCLVFIGSIIFYIEATNSNLSVGDFSDEPNIDAPVGKNNGGKLAIIIDDFGQSRLGVKEMMSINRHLTFAVMPFLEFSESDAIAAKEKGFEVIAHLSMEPVSGKISWLGPRPILAGMDNSKVSAIVRDAFDNVPFAVGANNHMGSKASNDENIMDSILEVIKEKNLYFVDSMTARRPVCKKIADQKGVTCYERNIFLDGQMPKSHVIKQLEAAEKIAIKKGKAIAIGHVGVEGGKVTAE